MRMAVLGLACAACATWTVTRRGEPRSRTSDSEPSIRTDTVPGELRVRDDEIVFAYDASRACTVEHTVDVEQDITWHEHMSVAGGLAVGLACPAAMLGAVGGRETAIAIIGITGLVLCAPAAMHWADMQRVGAHRWRVTTEHTQLEHATRVVPCVGLDPAAALGELELTTPGGAVARARIGGDGLAHFRIAAEPGELGAAGWQLRAAGPRALVRDVPFGL